MLVQSFKQLLAAGTTLVGLAAAAPTIYLAGDSTMVATGNNDGTEGLLMLDSIGETAD